MSSSLEPKRLEPTPRGPWLARHFSLLLLFAGVALGVALACQRQPARFPHVTHLGLSCGAPGQKECLTCVTCHNDIVVERKAGHPKGDDCKKCHEGDAHSALASLAAPETMAHRQASTIVFDHAKHLAMTGLSGQCIECHSGVVSETSGPSFPPMSKCFTCHEHREEWDQGKCDSCHRRADLKRIVPETFLRHGPGWDRQHGIEASNSVLQCQACHTAESCDDCHDVTQGLKVEVRQASRVDKDFIHPADFLTRHAMEASSEPARCVTCHRPETCQSCHQARGVSASVAGAVNPHPPGWMGPSSASPDHHGSAARRDALACASCHDQGPQTNCIRCHQVGGPGGNPHPVGWQTSRSPTDPMCRYCHGGP